MPTIKYDQGKWILSNPEYQAVKKLLKRLGQDKNDDTHLDFSDLTQNQINNISGSGVGSGTTGNLPEYDSNGDLKDSGHSLNQDLNTSDNVKFNEVSGTTLVKGLEMRVERNLTFNQGSASSQITNGETELTGLFTPLLEVESPNNNEVGRIDSSNFQNSSVIYLKFDSTVTVKHKIGTNNDISLTNKENYTFKKGDMLVLQYHNYNNFNEWREVGRMADKPVSGNFVGDSDSQTLTNKTIDANDNTFQNLNIPQYYSDLNPNEESLSVSSNTITPTENFAHVSVSSNTIIDTIDATNFNTGDFLFLKLTDNGNSLNLQTDLGNIKLKGEDYIKANTAQFLHTINGEETYLFAYDGTNWNELANWRPNSDSYVGTLLMDKSFALSHDLNPSNGSVNGVGQLQGISRSIIEFSGDIGSLESTNYDDGAIITLRFNGTSKITSDSGAISSEAIILDGQGDETFKSGDTLTLQYHNGNFKEIGRKREYQITSQTASGTNGSYTSSGEDLIKVDTATNTTAFTVTISDNDINSNKGNKIRIKDSGGGAGSNAITINTQSSQNIDSRSSISIVSNYGSVTLISDGTNLFTF